MKLQKLKIVFLLLVIVVTLVGCGKVKETPPPTSSELETESTTENQVESDSNLYLAYRFVDEQKKYGYIDHKGDFVIEPTFNYGNDFSEGFAVVSDGSNYEVIDKNGQSIFKNEGIIEPFKNGLAVFTDQSTYKYGYIDTSGNVVIKPTYLMATAFNADGNAVVSSSADALTVINKKGDLVNEIALSADYTGLYDVKDGFAIFIKSSQDGSKLGVVSFDGQTIIPAVYNGISNLGNGNFAVKDPTGEFYDLLDTPSAIFDKTGTKLTDYIYYDVKPYQGDFASASDATHTFFIGLDGAIAPNLPKIKGLGTLTFTGDLIKSDIDGALSYMTEDGTLAWQADQTYKISDTIIVKQNKERLHRTALIIYPSIDGLTNDQVEAAINATLKSLFIDIRTKDAIVGLSIDDQFDATLNGDLLTIHKSGYDYPTGAAHGMPISDYYQFDIQTGTFYKLKDLFEKNSGYLEKLDIILTDAIQKSYDSGNTMVFPESFKGLTEEANFIITETALIIYFYPYDIAAYAAGFQEYSIPYEDLMDIIDIEGTLWKSFKQ